MSTNYCQFMRYLNEDYFTDAKPLEVVQNRGLTLKQYQEMTTKCVAVRIY
jgi:hypothetical protein